MKPNTSLATLAEDKLLRHFAELVRVDQRGTAQLLAAIAEIDERKLWAKHAYPSMFAFCVERFHMSEQVAAKRIWAARTARRFPLVFAMVALGELHLSAIQLLAKHLTEDNHRRLLARAKHKSRREIELLVAEIAPRPDAPTRIRALPRGKQPAACALGSPGRQDVSGLPPHTRAVVRAGHGATEALVSRETCWDTPGGFMPEGACEESVDDSVGAERARDSNIARGTLPAPRTASLPRKRQVVALAPARYKVEITVDQQTRDKLRMLGDLLSHQTPSPDAAMIIGRAIDVLLDETLKKKAALTSRGSTADRAGSRRTRGIPAAIRRAVWKRDGGRCTFVDERGRRCRATRLVEYHHEIPYGKGGLHEVGNITLRCRAHNQYQADLDFGVELMRGKRRSGCQHSLGNVDNRPSG